MSASRLCADAQLAEPPSRAPDDVGRLHHDDIAEHLIANDNRRQHQSVGVPSARLPDRWITRGEEGWGSGP